MTQLKQISNAGVLPLLGEVRWGGFMGGDALYTARVMLDINPDELVFYYFAENMQDSADNLFENLPILYQLQKADDLKVYEQASIYYGLLKNFKTKAFDYANIGETYKNWLISITDSITDNYFSANARALHLQYDTTYHYSEPVWLPEEEELKMTKPYNKPDKSIFTTNISINPNPANNYIIISYAMETIIKNASLEIYDALGKKRDVFTVILSNDQKLIKCDKYAKGMYHCILRNNGEIIATSKFNVIK